VHANARGNVYYIDMRTRRRQRGFSLIELLIVIAIIMIIVTTATIEYQKAMMNSHETAAIGAFKAIAQAETLYYSQFGKFAQSLNELGPPASGGAEGPASAGLIAKDLADGKKSGYVFTIAGTPLGYSVTAVPESFNSTGRRTFFSDQSMIIHENWGQEPATEKSPELK